MVQYNMTIMFDTVITNVCAYIYIYIYIYIIHMYNEQSEPEQPTHRPGLEWNQRRWLGQLTPFASRSLPSLQWEVGGIRLETSSNSCWVKKTYHGPQCTSICVNNRGVRFHRIRDVKHYYFNSILPTSHSRGAGLGWDGLGWDWHLINTGNWTNIGKLCPHRATLHTGIGNRYHESPFGTIYP